MRWLVKLGRRFRLLMARGAVEREMAEEFQAHLEEEARALEREGRSPAEARRQAALAFGGQEPAKEAARDTRGGRWLDDIRADLRYAVRQALRAPGHTTAVVGILGVAIAGATIALALARGYLVRPLPIPEPDRLVAIIQGPSRAPLPNPPNLRAVDWAATGAFFEETVAWDLDGFTLVGGAGAPESVEGSWVSAGFFRALGIVPMLGRGFESAEYVPGATVALISDRLWRRRFGGDSGVIGATVRAHSTDRPDEEALVTIVGVLPPVRWEVHRFTDMLRPLATPRFFSLARLPVGMSRADAADRLTTAVRAQATTDPSWRMTVVSAHDEHVATIRPVIQTLVAASVLLLLLAEASVGALLVARGTARAHELVVRRALGATRARLARQLVVESGLVFGAAVVLGLALAPAFDGLTAQAIEDFGRVSVPGGVESVGLDLGIVVAVVGAALVPFALLALVPMMGILRTVSPVNRGAHRASPSLGAVRTRRVLGAVQVAAAVALVTPGLMLARSVREMLTVDLGFESTRLLKGYLLLPRALYPDQAARVQAIDRILARVRQVPGVAAATAIDHPPFRGLTFTAVECEACRNDPTAVPLADPQVVDPSYWETMGIPVLSGRRFDERDTDAAPPVAMVSESLAHRLWPTGDAIGQRVRTSSRGEVGPWRTVVGVTADVRKTYSDSLFPDLYRPNAQEGRAFLALVVRTVGDPAPLLDPVREAVAAEHEALALAEFEPMTDLLAAQRGRTGILASMVGAVAALAFALTGFGLYAVVGYLVRLRRREFAIRSALGARPGTIVAVVVRDASGLLVVGVALGLAVALGSAGLIRSFLVGVSPAEPGVYLSVTAAVVGLVVVALVPPARRAAGLDPAVVLREE